MKMNGETTLSTIPKPDRPVRSVRTANGSQVDWEALHRKVLESSSRLALVDEAPTGVLEQTWARRAAQIARVIEAEETGNQIEIVVVRLGKELYGLEADFVFDIRQLENITPVPRVPDWVAGVVNLRGQDYFSARFAAFQLNTLYSRAIVKLPTSPLPSGYQKQRYGNCFTGQ
jgi:hypothetical protein